MGHIVFAWELGSNLGHLVRHLPIARQLSERGHDISFVLKDLSRAQHVLGRGCFNYFQAPIWLPPSRTAPKPPQSYSEILQHFGYLSVDGLSALVQAWRNLFQAIEPSLVLFDYAPTGQLAARGLPFPTATIGGGFELPPAQAPTPAFPTASGIDSPRLQEGDARVLRVVNEVLARLGQDALRAVHELTAADGHFLCTLPPLDPYPRPAGVRYSGPIMATSGGEHPTWGGAESAAIRAFVYLKPNDQKLPAVLQALKAVGAAAEVYVPSLPQHTKQAYASHALRLSSKPLDVVAALEGCDLCICNGGHDTTAGAISMGKPVLLLPQQAEQLATAVNVHAMGVGDIVAETDDAAEIARKIQRVARGREAAKARDYAAMHPEFRGAQPVEEVVARCEALLQR